MKSDESLSFRPRTASADDSAPADSTAPGGIARTHRGIPKRIGRYEIRSMLGEGAFGRVYRGFDPGLHREVAIKVPHALSLTPELRERFLREARAAATIHHPNVCPIYDVGTADDAPYLVMHFVQGGTLAGLLSAAKSPFSPVEGAAIVRKIALGVAAAHAKGVLHRDLKPANVLWDEANREVLVTDFGLARIGGSAQLSHSGEILGTPAYMSPEQARGRQDEIGPLADVYSLGVILYRVLTGRVPFDGSVMEVLANAQFAEPVAPSTAKPGLDRRLDAICLKALAKWPGGRFPSAKDFAAALADFIRTGAASKPGASLVLPAHELELEAENLPVASEYVAEPVGSRRQFIARDESEEPAAPWEAAARADAARLRRNRALGIAVVVLLIIATAAVWRAGWIPNRIPSLNRTKPTQAPRVPLETPSSPKAEPKPPVLAPDDDEEPPPPPVAYPKYGSKGEAEARKKLDKVPPPRSR